MLTIVGLSRGLIEASQTRTRGVGADILVRPPGAAVIGMSGAPMPEKIVEVIEKQPNVAIAQGVVIHGIGGLESITGIDIDKFERMSGGLDYREGRYFPSSGRHSDRRPTTRSSRSWMLAARSSLPIIKWTVRGIVGPGKLSKIFAQKNVLQDLTSNNGKITMVYVKVKDAKNVAGTIADLKKLLEGYQIYSMEEFLSLITPDKIIGSQCIHCHCRRAGSRVRISRRVPCDVYGRAGTNARDRHLESAGRESRLHHRHADARNRSAGGYRIGDRHSVILCREMGDHFFRAFVAAGSVGSRLVVARGADLAGRRYVGRGLSGNEGCAAGHDRGARV